MWGFTLDEVKPYHDYIERDILFREAVIGTLIDEKYSQKNVEDSYCQACKTKNPDIDCSTCTRDIVLEKPAQEKIIASSK
jgi:hypothetical protein